MLLLDIEAGEEDIRNGRVHTLEQVKAHFDNMAKRSKH